MRLQGALFLENSAPINCNVSGIALVVRDAARNIDAAMLGCLFAVRGGTAIIPAWPNGRVRAAEPRGDGGPLHLPGSTLRAAERHHHQQPALPAVGEFRIFKDPMTTAAATTGWFITPSSSR